MLFLRKILRSRAWWLGVPLLLAFSFRFTAPQSTDRYFDVIKSLDIFATLFKELHNYYVDEPQPLWLMEQAITPMLSQLDPYTVYISEEKIGQYQLQHSGSYADLGIQVAQRHKNFFVKAVHEHTEEISETGIRLGDLLTHINHISLKNRSLEDLNILLKGEIGTSVSLKLQRPGTTRSYEIQLKRKKSNPNSVPYYFLLPDKDIGYIRLSTFDQQASAHMQRALQELKEAGAQGFILDLRDNSGGLLNEAVRISNFFVPRGTEIVRARGRKEKWNRTYYAKHEPIDTKSPLVLLVNAQSASASEIVSGVVQDYDRGLIVGEKTYGKGLVQATVPLVYNAQARITTARYYTPSGRCIQAIDYSQQRKTGAVTYEAAAQRSFYTQNQRPVYDRGGIAPDVPVITTPEVPLLHLLSDSLVLFDYATIYRNKRPSLVHPHSFSLTEKEYLAFQSWALQQASTYQTPAYKALQKFKASLPAQPPQAALAKHIQALENELRTQLKNDLKHYRKDIQRLLEEEILSHYPQAIDAPSQRLAKDPYLKEAATLITDTRRYAQLLGKK